MFSGTPVTIGGWPPVMQHAGVDSGFIKGIVSFHLGGERDTNAWCGRFQQTTRYNGALISHHLPAQGPIGKSKNGYSQI